MFTDPTRGGTILSEIKFLDVLQEKNPDVEFVILTVNESLTKKIKKHRETGKLYAFPHKFIKIEDSSEYPEKLKGLSGIFTYPWHSNFYGGALNENVVRAYKMISYATNEMKIPVFMRLNDSEIRVRDYRLMSAQRLLGDPNSAFLKMEANVSKAKDLVENWKQVDYTKMFWVANGLKAACDWVAETMYDREQEYFRAAPREVYHNNAIYVSDDIFFLIRKNFERFKYLEAIKEHQDRFCYIGFFDTVNIQRIKALHTLFKSNTEKVPLHIFGQGTDLLSKLKTKPNVELTEGFLLGDSDDYFRFLHDHLAYVFIGKGSNISRYIGKTLYDSLVARTPIAVYRQCDSRMIAFSSDEFYFDDEAGLKKIYEKLQDPATRDRWLKEQTEEIFSRLPEAKFDFKEHCSASPDELWAGAEDFVGIAIKKATPVFA